LEQVVVPPELSGVLELFTPQVADSGRQKRLQFLENEPSARPQGAPPVGASNPRQLALPQHHLPGWSAGNHLHLGFARRLACVLSRERMLEEMTRQVISRLQLDPTAPACLLDMGCGLGASALQVARQHPRFSVDGISLAAAEVSRASELAAASGMARRLRFWVDDFKASRAEGASYDGVYAIESACFDAGLAKEGFVSEASRLLVRGRRLVVADAFYKGEPPRKGLLGAICSRLHQHWGLETFGEIAAFSSSLRRHGFTEIRIEEISGHVAASALHLPLLAMRARGSLLASLLAPSLGLARSRFGYFIVSARRRRI